MQPIINADTPPSVMAGLVDRKRIAAALDCSVRTVIRREREGMPFIAVGRLRLYDPSRVREWLMRHEHSHETPKRGRARKNA